MFVSEARGVRGQEAIRFLAGQTYSEIKNSLEEHDRRETSHAKSKNPESWEDAKEREVDGGRLKPLS